MQDIGLIQNTNKLSMNNEASVRITFWQQGAKRRSPELVEGQEQSDAL